MTVITKRVASGATTSLTKRVSTTSFGAVYDTWADSWANAWANSWKVAQSGSAIGHTQRVPGGATTSLTKRVTL